MSGAARWAVALLGVIVIAMVDYWTGTELRVFPLYFFPISLGAWVARRGGAFALAAVASVAWLICNASVAAHSPAIFAFNAVMQAIAFVVVGLLLAEVKRRLDHEMETSRADPLTGLANRRGFAERAELLLAMARRRPRPIALALVDLDRFKEVNDTRGHHAGDAVLQAVAEALRRSLRASDLAARIGGDELAILMPDTDADEARAVHERLRSALAEAMASGGWPVTASVGIACVTGPAPTLDAFIARADELLYEAKQAGRDRARIADLESGLENQAGASDSPA